MVDYGTDKYQRSLKYTTRSHSEYAECGQLKQFIIQQMRKYIIRRYNGRLTGLVTSYVETAF